MSVYRHIKRIKGYRKEKDTEYIKFVRMLIYAYDPLIRMTDELLIDNELWYQTMNERLRCMLLFEIDNLLKRHIYNSKYIYSKFLFDKNISDYRIELNEHIQERKRKGIILRKEFLKIMKSQFIIMGKFQRVMDSLIEYHLRPPTENLKGGYLYLEAKSEFESCV